MGRILATDDWSQTPDSYSGLWYHNDIEGVNLELFWINDFFTGIGSNGSRNLTGDWDLYGIVLDYTTDAIEFFGDLTIMPYYLRHSEQAGAEHEAKGHHETPVTDEDRPRIDVKA